MSRRTRWRRDDGEKPAFVAFYNGETVSDHPDSVAMAMSTFQKVTLATCLVLCVALLLPKMLLSRGRKDAAERPDGTSPLRFCLIRKNVLGSIHCRFIHHGSLFSHDEAVAKGRFCSFKRFCLYRQARLHYMFLPAGGARLQQNN